MCSLHQGGDHDDQEEGTERHRDDQASVAGVHLPSLGGVSLSPAVASVVALSAGKAEEGDMTQQ